MTVATRAVFTGAIPGPTPGTWTPDGSPATIDAGTGYKAFPGVVRLDPFRLLLVYYHGTTHVTDGIIKGRIGTLSGTSVSWGSEFTIHDHATLDVRCDDAVSVIDGKAVITGRYYDGSDNIDPFLLVSDDAVADVDSSTTWTKHDIALAEGADENIPGHLIKVGSTYVLPCYHDMSSTYPGRAGVLRNASLTDWSAPTYVEVTGSNGYTEIQVQRLWGEYLLALIRTESDDSTSKAVSTDGGATWGSVSAAHDGYGFPMFRRLTDSTLLTVYRDSPAGDTAWRTSADGGATWSSETILDTTGAVSVYATLVQLGPNAALCVYAVEVSGTDADIYSQVFTRS